MTRFAFRLRATILKRDTLSQCLERCTSRFDETRMSRLFLLEDFSAESSARARGLLSRSCILEERRNMQERADRELPDAGFCVSRTCF